MTDDEIEQLAAALADRLVGQSRVQCRAWPEVEPGTRCSMAFGQAASGWPERYVEAEATRADAIVVRLLSVNRDELGRVEFVR